MPERPGACPDPTELHAFHVGERTGPAARRVAEHAAHCDVCRRELDELALDDRHAAELRRILPSGPMESHDGPARADTAGEGPSAEHRALLALLRECHEGGRYDVVGELGQGGMGIVYEVRDRVLERELAMKVASSERRGPSDSEAPSGRRLARFLAEARIMGRLDHPSIVPVYELGIDARGRAYFTMGRVRGQDLREVFEQFQRGHGDWSLPRLVALIVRACDALAYAHSRRVVHCDVKPANIMVGRFGVVYVMDWGVAKVEAGRPDGTEKRTVDSRGTALEPRPPREPRELQRDDIEPRPAPVTLDGEVLGTPAYMAPEQARGRRGLLDSRTDVYAMGAIFYELLSGQRPYDDGAEPTPPVATWARLLDGPPKPLRDIAPDAPPELVAVCERAMARDPAARYVDMEGLAADVRAWLDGRVVSAHESGTWAETKKWLWRNKPLAGSLAALVLALAAGLVTSLVFKSRADDNAALALREREAVLQLSAFQELEDQTREADTLWPATPDRIEALRAWLARARDLIAGLEPNPVTGDPGHRAQLARLRAELGAAERAITSADDDDRWWHAQLAKLVAELLAFADEDKGLVDGHSPIAGLGVARRLVIAEELRAGFAPGGALRARWERDLPAIHAVYPGLVLPVQMGLVPIGADSRSGLWEFWHQATGEEPVRGADGSLRLTAESGVVLVLLPEARFWMGAQSSDPAGRNFDAAALSDESPVHEVALSAFFLAKHELTQGQWERMTRHNPSGFRGPRSAPDLRHPVEQVSWLACATWLPRVGLALPSEAQWEYGARAGTDTSFWTGADRETLRGMHAANLADQSAARGGFVWPGIKDWPELDDGAAQHAQIGTYAPNAFGLHEIHGNLWEWCADSYGPYARDLATNPVEPANDTLKSVNRGGGYDATANLARASYRGGNAPLYESSHLGVRPARAILE